MDMKTKKTYIKPLLVEHCIDNEISLIMTSPNTPPDPWAESATTSSVPEEADISTLNETSFDQNPFDAVQ